MMMMMMMKMMIVMKIVLGDREEVSTGWGPQLTLQNKQLLLLLLLLLNLIIINGYLSLMVHKQDEHSKYYN